MFYKINSTEIDRRHTLITTQTRIRINYTPTSLGKLLFLKEYSKTFVKIDGIWYNYPSAERCSVSLDYTLEQIIMEHDFRNHYKEWLESPQEGG